MSVSNQPLNSHQPASRPRRRDHRDQPLFTMSTATTTTAATSPLEIVLMELPQAPHELSWTTEVNPSPFDELEPGDRLKAIADEFNGNRRSIMTTSVFGKRIEPNSFRLVALDNVPELVLPSEQLKRKKLYPNPLHSTEEIGIFPQTALFLGAYGTFVVNVPPLCLAKVWYGNVPALLGPGSHVVHEPNLRPITDADLVNVNTPYIEHGTYRIIRVLPGTVQSIRINNEAYFLTHRGTPYVFNEAVFERVGEPFAVTAEVIKHGQYNIIQIPAGKIAKIIIGTKPQFLEASDKPYIYTDPSFRLIAKDSRHNFEDASDRLIVHGSLKRLLPRTGEVAVTYDAGNLRIIPPPRDGKPFLIESATHSVEDVLATNIQTMEFPSAEKQAERLKNNDPDDDGDYEIFRTGDGLPVGVRLLVVYEVADPEKLLRSISVKNLHRHIESVVCADMGLVIQGSSSSDFTKANQPQVRADAGKDPMGSMAAEFYMGLQKRVYDALRKDFSEIGINLSRLNVETPKILDKDVCKRMAEFSLMNTETRAQEQILDGKANIARQQANQEALSKKIALEQANEAKVASARAELEAAKLQAEARNVQVEAEASAKKKMAEAEAASQQMLLEVQQRRAEQLQKYVGLLELEKAKVSADAMKGISSMVVSPDVAAGVYMNTALKGLVNGRG